MVLCACKPLVSLHAIRSPLPAAVDADEANNAYFIVPDKNGQGLAYSSSRMGPVACRKCCASRPRTRKSGLLNAAYSNVRFSPHSDQVADIASGPMRATSCREHLQQTSVRTVGRLHAALVSESAAPHRAATSLNRRKVSMCSSRLAMRYIG